MSGTTGLRHIEFEEHFEFNDCASLKTWLDQFEAIDLSTIYIEHGEFDYVTFHFQTEVLSDGSKVHNIRIGRAS